MEEMQICKEHGKKRPWEPPTRPLSLFQTSPEVEAQYQAALSKCPKEINLDFLTTLNRFVGEGIVTDRNNLLRTEESSKQSWDAGMAFPICYESSFSGCCDYTPSMKKEVREYMDPAVASDYFDVLPPNKRMDIMYRGFFVIYPEGQNQEDPIFEKEPFLKEVVPRLISLLGEGAVEFHNFMTGSELELKDVIKANLFCDYRGHFYFITLKAFDKLSKNEVTCRSRVLCRVKGRNGWSRMAVNLPRHTYVESFCIVSDNGVNK